MPSIALKIATFTAIAIAVTTMPGQAADGPQPGLWKVSPKTQGPGAAFDTSQHHNGTFKMSVMAGPMPMEIVTAMEGQRLGEGPTPIPLSRAGRRRGARSPARGERGRLRCRACRVGAILRG